MTRTPSSMGTVRSSGRLVARVLAGAWCQSPPPVELSAGELAAIGPLLLGSGAGALAWWRIRGSALGTTPAALELREAYRLHSLEAALHERSIKTIVALLRSAGVEPVLVKGWAVARLYPEAGLRPYGDIDLCVRPEQYRQAAALLEIGRAHV